MSLNNMTPRQAASCMGKIQKKWTSYREKYLENLEIQEGICSFAPQEMNHHRTVCLSVLFNSNKG
jgi:hypothetical protein